MPLPIETGPDELRAHPRHTGRHGLDLVLALAAIFISLVSLFVAVEHGRIEERVLAAGTWPFLQENHSGDGDTETVSVINAGVGPLKLVSLRMMLDGRPVPDIAAFVRTCCDLSPADRRKYFVSSSIQDSVLRPGQANLLVRFAAGSAPATLRGAVARTMERLSWDACYCSVFDECWDSDLVGLRPRRVPNCPARTDSFNQTYFR